MQSTPVTVPLPDPLLRAARDVAHDRDITLGQLIRDALATEVARAHRGARSPVRADERLVAMLRAKLSGEFAYARDWYDLQNRLRAHSVILREAGGGLALFGVPSGTRLCKASDLGFSLNRLARQFRAPFPGLATGRDPWATSVTHPDETEVLDDGDIPV